MLIVGGFRSSSGVVDSLLNHTRPLFLSYAIMWSLPVLDIVLGYTGSSSLSGTTTVTS